MGSQLLAESLGRNPRFEITCVAAADKVLPLVSLHKSDIAVISVEFDSATQKGLQIARSLNTRYPDVRVVALLDVGSRESVMASFRCGAMGVFCRTEPLSELPTCIERVSRGEIWASRSHSQFLLEALRSTPSCEGIEAAKIDSLVANDFAERAQRQQRGDQRDLVDVDHPDHIRRADAEIGSNRGKSDIGDGGVERSHRERGKDRRHRPPPALRRQAVDHGRTGFLRRSCIR